MQLDEPCETSSTIAVLFSGGLDSSILVRYLLEREHPVQPIFVRCGLFWEHDELAAARRYLKAIADPGLCDLAVLDLPMAEVNRSHWSFTGREVPGPESPDEAVYLPGRNLLLTVKSAFWCQTRGISHIALATLKTNPFPDATPNFFRQLEALLATALSTRMVVRRPFEHFNKQRVMELGAELPLELTFSCIAPVHGQHCGRCNKCIERQRAFQRIDRSDFTKYVYHRESEMPAVPQNGNCLSPHCCEQALHKAAIDVN